MLFAVHALDEPNVAERRHTLHPEHAAHLKTAKDYGVTIVVGGPLVADDGTGAIGSLMVLDAADRTSAEKFNNNDPFFKNGVWAKVAIHRFDKRTG